MRREQAKGCIFSISFLAQRWLTESNPKIVLKVDLLKGKLGFDDAFNYKEEADLKSALRRYRFTINGTAS